MIDLYDYAYSQFSQFGQDGIILKLAELIQPRKYFVEFGSDGHPHGKGNTAALRLHGWSGLLMDQDTNPNAIYDLQQEKVSHENINELFSKYGVPKDLGFISIDIDGQDYWVWKELEWNPDILIVEANHTLGHEKKLAVPQDPNFKWTHTNFYGASRRAFLELGISKGYSCVSICVSDMIFVKDEHLHHGFKNVNDLDALDVAKTYLWIPEWERRQIGEQPWIEL